MTHPIDTPPTPYPSGPAQRIFEFVIEQWRAVLFSASIALILESLGLLRVLTKFSLLVVSSLASQGPVAPVALADGMPTVVLLKGEDFVTRYGERSPLDRCILAGDIQKLLDKSPARLAIDFDLAPMASASAEEQQCQRRLDDLLDRHADKLLLLAPFPASTEALLQRKHAWMLARCSRGLHFADGTLEQSLGLVTEQALGQDEAGRSRMAEQLHHGPSDHICAAARAAAADAHRNTWLNGLGGEHEEHEETGAHAAETVPINFRALTRKVAVLDLDAPAFARVPSLAGKPVFLGGDWGRDDSFLTAIGPLPGVVIHAARLASLAEPVTPLPPVVSVWGDIVIALCFAWVIGKFWHGYVIARRLDLHLAHAGRSTALSMLVMGTFVLVYLSLVLFFFLAAEHMFSNWGIVIAPLLIAVSILVDGFVSGPVEQISALLEAEVHAQHRAEAAPPATSEAALAAQLLPVLRQIGVAWALVAAFVAACVYAPGFSHGLAAWLFAGAQLTLLALLALQFVRLALRRRPAGPQRGAPGTLPVPAGAAAGGLAWRRIGQGGTLLRWLRRLIFWAVLAEAALILVRHSLHG